MGTLKRENSNDHTYGKRACRSTFQGNWKKIGNEEELWVKNSGDLIMDGCVGRQCATVAGKGVFLN